MRELDDGLDARRNRNHFAVAERPVAAASGARSAGAHISAPQDHQHVPPEHSPGEAREIRGARGCRGYDVAANLQSYCQCFVRIRSRSRNALSAHSSVVLPSAGARGRGVAAQNKKPNPDAGYIPVVAPEDKKKKKGDDVTQALRSARNCRAAVTAETARLAFQVTPLSSKGLLSQQTRDAIKGFAAIQSRTHRETARVRRGLGRFAAHRRDRRRDVPRKTSCRCRRSPSRKWARCRWKERRW